jgi:hypothetical protein
MKFRLQFPGVTKSYLGLIISVSLLLPSVTSFRQLVNAEGERLPQSNLIKANDGKIPESNSIL